MELIKLICDILTVTDYLNDYLVQGGHIPFDDQEALDWLDIADSHFT